MLKGYADVHVVFAVIQALRRRGMDVVTAQQRGADEAADAELLEEALAEQRVLLANDNDFLALAARCAAQAEIFAPIYFWPQQRRTVGDITRRIIREATVQDYHSACSHVHFL